MCNNDLVRTGKAFIGVHKKMALSLYDGDLYCTLPSQRSVPLFGLLQLRVRLKDTQTFSAQKGSNQKNKKVYCATEMFGYTPKEKNQNSSFDVLFLWTINRQFLVPRFLVISVTALNKLLPARRKKPKRSKISYDSQKLSVGGKCEFCETNFW